MLSAAHVRQTLLAHPGLTLINGYGPTEGTTFTCCNPMTDPEQVGDNVAIGRPIANTHIYVLDAAGHPVPVGVPGELYIGGDGVARGYWRRPELTAEQFLPDPYSAEPNARMYRTGDLVRYLADGQVQFLGRIDQQVKIRGYRIEPGEIEFRLAQHPKVRDCVVAVHKDSVGSARLTAYVVTHQPFADVEIDFKGYLKEFLPDYMVPSKFILLDAFPLNSSGKVDRRALPSQDEIPAGTTITPAIPRTIVEETLVDIWRQILKREQVSIHDNFFELGGDSIMCMQVIARARQVNIQLTPKQLFQYQTIAELAVAANVNTTDIISQDPVTGPVLLTPIQKWFFEQNLSEMHHYNQSALLETPAEIDTHALRQSIRILLKHHDALRLRFEQVHGDWSQHCAAFDELDDSFFTEFDISTYSPEQQMLQMRVLSDNLQASLDLRHGPLLRAGFFYFGPNHTQRLLLATHHLVVDGVSWRILLEDLETAYLAFIQQQEAVLPLKTTSYQNWALYLAQYAQSLPAIKNSSYWITLRKQNITALPVDHQIAPAANTEQTAQPIYVSLEIEETVALLQDVFKAYHTQMNDVLLTAVAIAIHDWTGAPTLQIDLEGHGREEIIEQANLARTVGWFTSIFPVYLDITGQETIGQKLTAIKEQLRAVPNHGVDYGILRYLCQDRDISEQLHALPRAEISFNYLGQFDSATAESGIFRYAAESGGENFSVQAQRQYLLEILGNITDNRLRFTWVYSSLIHNRETIEHVAQRFIAALREIITHCLSPEAGGHTPSDFPLAQLDTKKLSKLSKLIDEED